jgi:hypothetical protein
MSVVKSLYFEEFIKKTGVNDRNFLEISRKIWDASRYYLLKEEEDKKNQNDKDWDRELTIIRECLKIKPDFTFVFRNFGNKWVRNISYAYFRSQKLMISRRDENGWQSESADFAEVDLKQYERHDLGDTLPSPPYSIPNVYFADDLVFCRKQLCFTIGELKDVRNFDMPYCGGYYMSNNFKFLKEDTVSSVERMIVLANETMPSYSYRLSGIPSYSLARFCLPPHKRSFPLSRAIYQHKYNEDYWDKLDRVKWQRLPQKNKIEIVNLWRKGNRAESEYLFDTAKPDKANNFKRKNWNRMKKIAQLNTTAGLINEYHKSN